MNNAGITEFMNIFDRFCYPSESEMFSFMMLRRFWRQRSGCCINVRWDETNSVNSIRKQIQQGNHNRVIVYNIPK